MAFNFPRNLSRGTPAEQVLGLCHCATLGDVNKLRHYIYQEGIMLNADHVGTSALIMATEQGHVRAVKTLIAVGADVNMSTSEYKNLTPLMTAAEKGHVDCLLALINNGARVNESHYDGRSALTIAIQEGCSDDVTNIVNASSQRRVRASMGSLVTTANKAWRDLHEECALLLLQAGAEVSYTNDTGYSLLMIAAANGSSKILKAIIQAGGNINQTANDGTTSLMLACRCTSLLYFRLYMECVDVLIQAGTSVNATNLNGKTALILAVQNSPQYKKKFQRLDILQLLLQSGANPNARDKDGKTALIYAAEKNLSNVCELLINNLADVSIQDNYGKTAYMYVTDSRCLHVILSTKVRFITTKLKYDSYDQVYRQLDTDLNLQDKDGKSALIHAAQGNLTNCCELLINHYSDVNLQDKGGRTALMYTSKPDCLQALLTEPRVDISFLPLTIANPNIQDNNGKTALMYASEQNSVSCARLLIDHFAEFDIQDYAGKTAIMYASRSDNLHLLLSNGAKTDLLDYSECTALVHLLKRHKLTIDFINNVDIILEYGANPVLDPCHRHLLHLESSSTDLEYLMYSLVTQGRRQVIRFLVCNGFVKHFDHKFHAHQTNISPLICALKVGYIDIAKYLISSCYVCEADMRTIRKLSSMKSHHVISGDFDKSGETHLFIQQIVCQPWPLVKLAFIAVSSALGSSPEREQRITKTNLPPRLQRMLLFQEPVSRLPVIEWSNIPLCFDPVEYERVPKPRPLLYFWPFGRNLVI